MAKQRQTSAPSGPSSSLRVGQRLGSFQLEALLASEGMGELYAVKELDTEHTDPPRSYVAKLLSEANAQKPVAVARFQREIRIHQTLSDLAHPGIVTLHQHGEDDTLGPHMLMEHLQGQTLKQQLIAHTQPPPIDKVIRWVEQICDALRALHAQQVIHRDLKPANLFLAQLDSPEEQVKLIDFGIAFSPDEPDTLGEQLGTPRYMAPEQVRRQEVGPYTDVYALGGVLYEVFTRRVMYPQRESQALKQAQLERPAPPLSHARPDLLFAPALEDLMQSMLAKDPSQRPQTAQAVAEQLLPILRETPVQKKDGKLGLVLSQENKEDFEADAPTPAPTAPALPDDLDLDFADPSFAHDLIDPDEPPSQSPAPIGAIVLLLTLALGMCAGVVWWLIL